MRPPFRKLVPIGSLPYSVVVVGSPSTPASVRTVPAGLVVTSGGTLRARVNHPRYSKRNAWQLQSSQQPPPQPPDPQPQLLLQPQPPPPSRKLVGMIPLPTLALSATYKAFCSWLARCC